MQGVTVVTGGAGLIGSAVIWGINNQNSDNAWLIDQWENDSLKKRNLEYLGFRRNLGVDEFRELIRRKDPELNEVRTVIHLGACSSTTETDEDYLLDNNFLYTKELCEWSLSNVRFVYASSAATYGDGNSGMDDRDEDIEKFEPLNLYGWSKHKFDLLAKEQGWFDRITGLKYFNVYGPNEEHKGDMRSVVSKAYEQIAKTGRMTLFKSHRPDYRDGEQKRDFLYAKDAVRMTLWLTENRQATGLLIWETALPALGWISVIRYSPHSGMNPRSISSTCRRSFGTSTNTSPKRRSTSFVLRISRQSFLPRGSGPRLRNGLPRPRPAFRRLISRPCNGWERPTGKLGPTHSFFVVK